jgi:ketosteroid isomerase-like protein
MDSPVSDLVRRYYRAYEQKDRSALEGLLSDDLTFTSPHDDHIDRRAYFERCWPSSAGIRAFHIESLLDNDREALVRLAVEMDMGSPLRATEWFRSDGGKIKEIEVYFAALPDSASSAARQARPTSDDERQYLCLVYQDNGKLEALSQSEMDGLVGECVEWVDGLQEAGRHVFSAGLQSLRSATTVRNRNGKVSMTDGPFAETKEQLGGFTLLRARDLNEALQLASNMPVCRIGTIEVRPVLRSDTDSNDPVDRKVAAALRRNDRAAIHPGDGELLRATH